MAQINFGEDLQNFFNHDIGNMFKNMFKFPTTSVMRIENESKVKSIMAPLCTLVISYLVCMLLPLMYKTPFKYCALIALVPVLYMVFLTVFAFIVMAIKGKGDILKAFSITTIHAYNYTLFMIVISIILLFNPNKFLAIVFLLIIVYGLTMAISNMRQALSTIESEGQEAYTWWLAPVAVVLPLFLSMYLVGKQLLAMMLRAMI